MKVINFTLVVLFVPLLANIVIPFVLTNGIVGGIVFLGLSYVNRLAQPVAFGLCICGLFKKPQVGLVIFYFIDMALIILFFIMLIMHYMAMNAIGPEMSEPS